MHAHKGRPWPAYFLVRTTGEVVPLIAVDELPPGTDVIGVPRSLDLEETIGMLNLGLQRSSGAFYRILSADEKARGQNDVMKVNKPTTQIDGVTPTISHPSSNTPTGSPPTTPKVVPSQVSRCRASSISTSVNTTTTQQPQTQRCRHWCHHGICKWGQQCRYRHIMPMSTSGLQEVGLADWPVWFRRMNPGYFAAEVVSSNSNVVRAKGRRGAKSMGCTTTGGNGGACCGSLHGPGGIGRERVMEREMERETERESDKTRSRKIGRVTGTQKEKGVDVNPAKAGRSEELGEQIIARLRGMSREHAAKEKASEKMGDRLNSASLIERAAARDTKNWEDESDEEDNGLAETLANVADKKEAVKGNGNLVDI